MEGYRAFQNLSAANAEAVTSRGAVICEHGRPKGICGECFPSEPTIDRDREFDQTARSETPGPRTVSPSILEHRILMLKNELRVANADREQLAEQNAVLRKRIVGFEQMAELLSNKIDEMEATFKTLAGVSPAAFADPIVITSPSYFKDDQVCGYCNRQPGERHARNCRQ